MNGLRDHLIFSGKTGFIFCLLFLFIRSASATDLDTVVEGLQQRYSSVSTIKANFEQTYRAPGIEQVESGVFWIKKPGLMRWEYRQPEEKLFIADGKNVFLYVPQDRQVTVQPFSTSDMHSTPLEFLLGAGDISKSFRVSWELEFSPGHDGDVLIRLTPRRSGAEYLYLVLELDPESYELHGIIVKEPGGNTSRFAFTDMETNVKVNREAFQFKTPKGVEEIRYKNDR